MVLRIGIVGALGGVALEVVGGGTGCEFAGRVSTVGFLDLAVFCIILDFNLSRSLFLISSEHGDLFWVAFH